MTIPSTISPAFEIVKDINPLKLIKKTAVSIPTSNQKMFNSILAYFYSCSRTERLYFKIQLIEFHLSA